MNRSRSAGPAWPGGPHAWFLFLKHTFDPFNRGRVPRPDQEPIQMSRGPPISVGPASLETFGVDPGRSL